MRRGENRVEERIEKRKKRVVRKKEYICNGKRGKGLGEEKGMKKKGREYRGNVRV